MIPLFDWRSSEQEARSSWEGFLWSSRRDHPLYHPLMKELKTYFLSTADHYTDLGEHKGQYASLLTSAALDPGDTFTIAELSRAIKALPQAGLQKSARDLVRALEGAGDQRTNYWTNRVVPYFQSIWPKTKKHTSPAIAESFGQLCIAAGSDNFPDAFSMLRAWLQPLTHPCRLICKLNLSKICNKFPKLSLDFIDLVIDKHVQRPNDLVCCLNQIRASDATLESDTRYKRLHSL